MKFVVSMVLMLTCIGETGAQNEATPPVFDINTAERFANLALRVRPQRISQQN
jgi:hypothetical protein